MTLVMMAQRNERTVMSVGSQIKKPVTVHTNQGKIVLYGEKTINKTVNVYSAEDANGDAIIVSSSYNWKTGTNHNQHFSNYTRYYNFSTYLESESVRNSKRQASQTQGVRRGYSSSYGRYSYQRVKVKSEVRDDDDEFEDDSEEEEASENALRMVYRASNDISTYGSNTPPLSSVEPYRPTMTYYWDNLDINGKVKSIEYDVWYVEGSREKYKKTSLYSHIVYTYDYWGRLLSFNENYCVGKKYIPDNKTFTKPNGRKSLGVKNRVLYHYNEWNKLDRKLYSVVDAYSGDRESYAYTYDENGMETGCYVYQPDGTPRYYRQSEYRSDKTLIRTLYSTQFGFYEYQYDEKGRETYSAENFYEEKATTFDETIYDQDGKSSKKYHCYLDNNDNLQKDLLTETYYDENGKKLKVVDYAPFYDFNSDKYAYKSIYEYSYDSDGRLVQVKETLFDKEETQFAEGILSSYEYNSQGKIVSNYKREKSSSRIEVNRYSYDEQGKLLVREKGWQAGQYPLRVEFRYDENGNVVEALSFDDGKLSSVSTYKYTYLE